MMVSPYSFFFFGSRFAFRSASVMIHCSWPLVLRNSSAAQASIASIVSLSTRRMKFFVFFSTINRRIHVSCTSCHHPRPPVPSRHSLTGSAYA